MTPELPEDSFIAHGYFGALIYGYTKEKMIEYGKQVEAHTREECKAELEREVAELKSKLAEYEKREPVAYMRITRATKEMNEKVSDNRATA